MSVTTSAPSLPSIAHIPFPSSSSSSDVLQRSYELFNQLDAAHSHRLDAHALGAVLDLFRDGELGTIEFDDARTVLSTVSGGSETISFSQFHSVYAALMTLRALTPTTMGAALRKKDVKEALLRVGLIPTQAQIDRMFVLGDEYRTLDRRGPLKFTEFLRIYQSSMDNSDVFLHSWYSAGRNSTPYNKPVKISPVQDFMAGTAAGAALTFVGHPFDTVKVRLQTEQNAFSSGLNCAWRTVAKEGILGLYKGMSGPIFTIPIVNAIVFWSYAQSKDILHRFQKEPKPLTLLEITLCGSIAGFVNSLVTCPVELIKTRLQVQYAPHPIKVHLPKVLPKTNYNEIPPRHISTHELHTAAFNKSPLYSSTSRSLLTSAATDAATLPLPHTHSAAQLATMHPETFRGPIDCIRKIHDQNGIKGLFRGMSATIYREVPGYGGQFFCYEALKKWLTPEGHKGDLGAGRLIMAGGVAGIFGWVLSYPMDYVKSQIQAEPYDRRTPWKKNPYLFDGGFFDCWKRTVQKHGFKALWRGFGPCVARAFPANAAGFVAYEWSLKLIQEIDYV